MKVILMHLQNFLFADAVERSLREEGDFRIINISDAEEVVHHCKLTSPDVLLMEVKTDSPWTFSEKMEIRDALHDVLPSCKIVLVVNEHVDKATAEMVKAAKIDQKIDGFIFSSISTSYLAAVLQTV